MDYFTKKSVALIFPGQGAQVVGMGKSFFDEYSTYRELVEQAEDLLKVPLKTLMFEGPQEKLTKTCHSQLAIYVMSYAVYQTLVTHIIPHLNVSACAGLSLGEYTAITASGRLSYIDTLSLVKARGDYMSKACEETQGFMSVVMGLEHSQVADMVQDLNLPDDLWSANFNCPGQVVISGTKKGVEAGMVKAKELGAKRVIPLDVHGAFHSGLMLPAQKNLKPYVESSLFRKSKIALAMNTPGRLIQEEEIPAYLIKQVTEPVLWQNCVEALEPKCDLFLEIGPGKTLAGMNKRIGFKDKTMSVESVEDLSKLEALKLEEA